MIREDKKMILALAKAQDFKGLDGYCQGLMARDRQLDKTVKKVLTLADDALYQVANTAGDVPFWNKRGLGYRAHEAVRAAKGEFFK